MLGLGTDTCEVHDDGSSLPPQPGGVESTSGAGEGTPHTPVGQEDPMPASLCSFKLPCSEGSSTGMPSLPPHSPPPVMLGAPPHPGAALPSAQQRLSRQGPPTWNHIGKPTLPPPSPSEAAGSTKWRAEQGAAPHGRAAAEGAGSGGGSSSSVVSPWAARRRRVRAAVRGGWW